MPPENAIIAFSTNMPPERVALFCRSVRRCLDARRTEIVIITDDPAVLAPAVSGLDVRFHLTSCDWSPQTRKPEKALKRGLLHACRLFAATPLDRRLAGGAAGRIQRRLGESWCHPLTARWFSYRHALLERPETRKVLLTDVKDVILQSDCFAGVDEEHVCLFEQSQVFGEAPWDRAWVRQAWGAKALESMKETLPFNAGTILGGYRPMLSFLERVTGLLCRYPFRAVDQAAINYMLHREGDGPDIVRRPNIREQIATIAGDVARQSVMLRDGWIVRSADGSVIPLVHMWDRWQDLNEAVLERYGGSAEEEEMVEAPPESIFEKEPAAGRKREPASAARG
jgi:hypothetical protein